MTDRDLAAAIEFKSMLERSERGFRTPEFMPEKSPSFDVFSSAVKLFAYYLPQFHPFPENDEWWGKGFTEWTNVTRALPQFPGHYQPHLPSDLGFYDLRLSETLRSQVSLARQYGVSGFCFYHYWFGGKRLLEGPVDTFIAQKDIEHEFCLCWANENWTRRWDGAEAEVLIAQEHTPESDIRFIEDTLPYMEDPRYLHIDGRPVLIVYRVSLLPEPLETARRWRKAAIRHLGKDLFLIYATTFNFDEHPHNFGFDAAVQFPPHATSAHGMRNKKPAFREDYQGHAFEYDTIQPSARERLEKFRFPVIPAVFPSWDNTARRGHAGTAFVGSTPDLYATWLADAAYYAQKRPVEDKSLVFINAWNEWAEGAHLEPDQRFGHAYLRCTADVLRPYAEFQTEQASRIAYVKRPKHRLASTALIIHAYYPDVLEQMLVGLSPSTAYDIILTLVDETAASCLSILAKLNVSPLSISVHSNRGRDVLPFLHSLQELNDLEYTYFVKVHTKKSTHRPDGNDWSAQLFEPLITVLESHELPKILADTQIGVVAPAGHVLDGHRFLGSRGNQIWMERLGKEFDVSTEVSFAFCAGNMFAGRCSEFESFGKNKAIRNWFEDEQQRRDGTLAHALERFFGKYVASKGKNISALTIEGGAVSIEPLLNGEKKSYRFANAQPS